VIQTELHNPVAQMWSKKVQTADLKISTISEMPNPKMQEMS